MLDLLILGGVTSLLRGGGEEIDPQWISFPDLHQKICDLDCFKDDPSRSNEKILEAIQMAWIDETQ